jgi:putative tRNA adenosine deaminase-associated protein
VVESYDAWAVEASEMAALIWEAEADTSLDGDEDEGTRPVAEPVGDAALLSDLGTSAEALLELCAHEGMLPADVFSVVGERAGFLEVLDDLREV